MVSKDKQQQEKPTRHFTLNPHDNRRLANLCGQLNENLHLIERYLGVEINNRGNQFHIIGKASLVQQAAQLIQQLYDHDTYKGPLNTTDVQIALHGLQLTPPDLDHPGLTEAIIHTNHTQVTPRTKNQHHYLKGIEIHDLSFGIGSSGTGKTFLAVACAVAALEKNLVQRIVLVRPAVEAGEKLGFLPGSLSEKIDPYLRPLYDALAEMMGVLQVGKYIERGLIEIAPLAYMRGRTLNDAFIILDESQNTTIEQMKMFLTRIGFGSKVVITGDITQTDLPKSILSGLRHAISVLQDVSAIHFTFFNAQDIVRHPLVQQIIQAYEKAESGL